MSASPHLAWELIERIISHSGDDRRTRYSFSLTCRQLRPRSLCILVADVDITERARVVAFRDFLEAYPYFCPFVRSIGADPTTFMPFPLLHILPNLTNTQWSTPSKQPQVKLSLPQPLLTCYRRFGTNITSLSLSQLFFKTFQEFCRVLLAFTALKDLSCRSLEIGRTATNGTALQQRLKSQRLELRTIDIGPDVHEAVMKLLFELAQSTVERLFLYQYMVMDNTTSISSEKWPELFALTLTASSGPNPYQDLFGALIKISKELDDNIYMLGLCPHKAWNKPGTSLS
ncbi:hypothetical protein BD311DRAFT_762451 [Dichomitus squalens]|uniref:F-box domain-containing protein n=1 Tax=Dichomitus squalens TaxID=114155 RepID=A0A4Q9MII6_9APHY|nr:hypothetical protein BD311DRAFT_762451 [Dichomitus squalens]